MRLALGLIVLVGLLGGCGFGEDEKGEQGSFVDRADVICSDAEHRISQLARPLDPSDPLQLASFLERALPIAREQISKLRELERPPELEERINALMGALNREVDAAARILEAARAQNAGAMQQAQMQSGIASAESRRLADDLDLAVCGGGN